MNLTARLVLFASVLLFSGTFAQATTVSVLKDHKPVATIELPPGYHLQVSSERSERDSDNNMRFSGTVEASLQVDETLHPPAESVVIFKAEELLVKETK